MRKVTWPVLAAIALVGCGNPAPEPPLGGARKPDVAEAAEFAPLPAVIDVASNPRTPEKVALGKMLYYDTRFSADGTVSCYVCHPLHDYGTTHRAKAVGHDHLQGGRNEPTVFNAAGQLAQFWDGRAPDVEAQALVPVLNPDEMGMKDAASVVAAIRAIPDYPDLFARAFPGEKEPVTFENFGRAIAAFERGLTTPSRWDQYLDGDPGAITVREKDGLRTFVAVGCSRCHAGTYVGGISFWKLGVVQRWPDGRDPGRVAVTGLENDRGAFKVPSLRNVEETWPYFHDGSVARLDDAIRLMARYQLGKELTDTQVTLIRGWLHSLTGEIDRPYIEVPVLPASPAGVKLQVPPLAAR